MNRLAAVYQFIFSFALIGLIFLALQSMPEPSISGDWQVVALDGSRLLPGSNATLKFIDGRFTGFGGCNDYGGAYSLGPAGSLQFSEIEMTAEACIEPAGVLEQEAAFFAALRDSSRFSQADGRLSLRDGLGRERILFEPVLHVAAQPDRIEGPRWAWVLEDGRPVISEVPAELRFDGGRLTGFSGCRHLTGTYVLVQDEVIVPSLSMIESGCDSAAGRDLENRFLDALDLFDRYSFTGDDLEIHLKTGKVLSFRMVSVEVSTDPGAAEETLRTLFDAIVGMDYETAAALHAGPADFYDVLAEYNPDVDPADRPALLAAGCLIQFRCMPLLEVVSVEPLGADAILFTVTFAEPDGSAFVLGACCGGEATAATGPAVFEYLVRPTEDGLKVFGGLVYVP